PYLFPFQSIKYSFSLPPTLLTPSLPALSYPIPRFVRPSPEFPDYQALSFSYTAAGLPAPVNRFGFSYLKIFLLFHPPDTNHPVPRSVLETYTSPDPF